MRVLVADNLAREGIGLLEAADGLEVDVRLKQTEDELVACIKDFQAVVVRSETRITRRIIEASQDLQIIARAGVGVDNIDVEAATEKGVVVVNAPEGNTIAAAEHTVAMMMAMARNIPQASGLLHNGIWEKKKFMGVELRRKILGIIGLGKIGAEVAKRARGLEMEVIAYDPYVSNERAERMGVSLGSFQEILQKADFLTVHLPLTMDSRHLIGSRELGMVKPGVRILNVARGGIIDEKALYEALVAGRVAGAAIDVFEKEPITDSPLFTLDQVIVTPHLGASTAEAQVNVAMEVAQEIVRLARGEQVLNAVNIPSVKAELRPILAPYQELAERLGRFTAQLINGSVEQLRLEYRGEFAQYDLTSLSNAILKGFLRSVLAEGVNYVNAPSVAKARGIKVVEEKSRDIDELSNMIAIEAIYGGRSRTLAGAILEGNQPRLVRLDGYRVDAVLEGNMLVIMHIDQPRIIGPVGNTMGARDINIAGMQVGRKEVGGKAVMFLNIDAPVSSEALAEIGKIDGVLDVSYVCL